MLSHQQSQILGCGLAGADPPPVDTKAAGHGHDQLLFAAAPGSGIDDECAPFAAEAIAGLKLQKSPGQLAQRPAQARIAALRHAALLQTLAGTVFARTEPEVTADLAAVLEAVPIPDLAFDHLLAQGTHAFGSGYLAGALDLFPLHPDLFMQGDQCRVQGIEELDQPRRHFQFWPVACAIPLAFQPVAVLKGQTATALGDQFQVPLQALPNAAFRTQPFLLLGRHSHEGQRSGIARDKPVQRIQHRQSVGAVGFHPFVLIIPVARTDHVVGHAQRRQLAMQPVAERTRFVAGNNLPALGDLLLDPFQKVFGRKALRRLGGAAVVLHGHHVLGQMDVQRQLQGARLDLGRVIYRLRYRNRRSRSIVVMHMGRHCGTRVRPVSALMFSNTALEPTPTAP